MSRCPHRFGPAGKPISFKGDLSEVPSFLKSINLNAMEYEAVRGVNIKRENAELFGSKAIENDVLLSLHGPYFINLASPDEKTFEASVKRVYESIRASHWMKAYAVVIHTGYYGDLSSNEALKRAINGYKEAIKLAMSDGYTYPFLAPETTGKNSQIGTVEEIVTICLYIERCRPTIDWAHIYARSRGELIRNINDVIRIIDYVEKNLGRDAVNPLHTHFSKIEIGRGGEKEHHNLEEELYGPSFDIVIKAYKELGIVGTIISESPVLEKDALLMRKICDEIY